jgi:hypothetical protein
VIPEFLRPYSKLVVAVAGVAVLVALNRFGVQNADLDSVIVGLIRDSIIGALTTWGVYQVTNTPADK